MRFAKNLVSERLMQLDIDLNSINHETYDTIEFNRYHEVGGLIKASGSKNISIWKFNEIEIYDYKNTTRLILLTKLPAEESDIKNIVNSLSEALGEDYKFKTKLQKADLDKYRKSEFGLTAPPLRKWENFSDYDITLKGFFSTKQLILIIKTKS